MKLELLIIRPRNSKPRSKERSKLSRNPNNLKRITTRKFFTQN